MPEEVNVLRSDSQHDPERASAGLTSGALVAVMVLSVAALWMLHPDAEALRIAHRQDSRIVLPTALGRTVAALALLVPNLVALTAAALLAHRGSRSMRVGALTFVGLALPAVWCLGELGVPSSLRSASKLGSIGTAEVPGALYLHAETSPVHGGFGLVPLSSLSAIVWRAHSGPMSVEYEILAATEHDVGNWGELHRPAPLLGPARRGQVLHCGGAVRECELVVTDAGVVGVRDDGLWALVWNSRDGKTLWGHVEHAAGLLVLLDEDDEPNSEDVSRLLGVTANLRHFVKSEGAGNGERESEAPILEALDDPRPAVRRAVESLVEAGGPELYPRAMQVLAARRR